MLSRTDYIDNCIKIGIQIELKKNLFQKDIKKLEETVFFLRKTVEIGKPNMFISLFQ